MSSKKFNNSPKYFENLPEKDITGESLAVIEKPKLTHEQLHEALFWIQDMMERSTILFCVVGELGKQIVEQEIPCLKADKIELMVQKSDLHEFGFSMFNTLMNYADYVKEYRADDKKIYITYRDVPIEITIVHNMYPFFRFPDSRCYTVTEFKLPNPFSRYWEIRNEIE